MDRNIYRIIGRGNASFIFPDGQNLEQNYNIAGVPGRILLLTRYIDCGYSVPVPGDLAVVADVEATSVEEAAKFVTRATELASIVAVATNAAADPFIPEVIYDATPGKRERAYFQRFMGADKGTFSSRIVPEEAVALANALAEHGERDRLIRAISQYSEALRRWSLGNELLTIAHLWMGVEALKKAAWRAELVRRGISKAQLAEAWGFKSDGRIKVDEFLDREARVRLIFHGDSVHHGIAKRVSDSFEHGFENGGKLFAPAASALIPTAAHLRRAIFETSSVPAESLAGLLDERLAKPRGLGGLEEYLRATLTADTEQLGEEGVLHPYFEWRHEMKDVTRDSEGVFGFQPKHTFTARFGPGVSASKINVEIWDGGTFTPQSAADLEFGPVH